MLNSPQAITALTPRVLKRPELLAPAGDWECARAAVENGADAIYFGLERFNARMRAKNFTQSDLPELMAFLHSRGVRVLPITKLEPVITSFIAKLVYLSLWHHKFKD